MGEPERINLGCNDGYPLAASLYRAPSEKAALVLAPALGVPQTFYARYANYLALHGISVLTFDYRGSGASAHGPARGRDIRMQDWGALDIEAALAWLLTELKPDKLFFVGHSAGGQLFGLAPSSQHLRAAVLVGATAPYLRHYPRSSWPKLLSTWYLLAPLLSWHRDSFPARQIGLGSTSVAAGVVAQWAHWARTPEYLFDDAHGIDTQRYAQLTLPILSHCFSDDELAPPPAVDALLKHFPAANIERQVHTVAADDSIGHFGYFRKGREHSYWQATVDWLYSQDNLKPNATNK